MKKCPACARLKTRCAECLRYLREVEIDKARAMTILPQTDMPTTSIEHGDRLLGTGFRINEPFEVCQSPRGAGVLRES